MSIDALHGSMCDRTASNNLYRMHKEKQKACFRAVFELCTMFIFRSTWHSSATEAFPKSSIQLVYMIQYRVKEY